MRTLTYWASLILIFTIPFEKLITFGDHDAPTFTKFLGLFVAGVWLASVFVTDKFRKPRPFHLAVILFVLWNIVSVFWSKNADQALSRAMTYLQLVGLVLVLWDIYLTPAMVRVGLQAYILGGYISVGSTISNFVTGITAHEQIVRYTATGFNENEISLVLALGIPIAWYLAVFAQEGRYARWLRWINYAYVPLSLFAILLTASRGGLISTFPAFLFILATFTRLRLLPRVLLFLALIGALFAVQSFVPESSYERLAGASDEIAEGDLTGRVDIWLGGLDLFLEHPLIGVGTGMFQFSTVLQRAAHNAYLEILVELGLIGFILFLIVLMLATYHAMRLPKWESRLWLAVLVIWAVSVSALSLQYRKPTWLVLSLPVIVANTSRGRDQAEIFTEPIGSLHPAIPQPQAARMLYYTAEQQKAN
jgi:O-antigen ligase